MSALNIQNTLSPVRVSLRNTLALVLLISLFAQTAQTQSTNTMDKVERSMYFIDRSIEATEYYNQGKTQEALDILQDLAANFPDLDEDGYVALSLGDCLAALERRDEAWDIYQRAFLANPDLASKAEERIWELRLAGEIDDDLIGELRQQVATEPEGRFAACFRLGRALQKRAAALLTEAVDTFRMATDTGMGEINPTKHQIRFQADQLAIIVEELNPIVKAMEDHLGPVAGRFKDYCRNQKSRMRTENYRAEWQVQTADRPAVTIVLRQPPDCALRQVIVNGKPIELDESQWRSIETYQERINAVLMEAVDKAESDRRSKPNDRP